MKPYAFGVDVGGTTVKMGLFTTEGDLLDKWEIPTRTEHGGESVLPDIASSIREKLTERAIAAQDVEGIGIGVPGPVDGDFTVHNGPVQGKSKGNYHVGKCFCRWTKRR